MGHALGSVLELIEALEILIGRGSYELKKMDYPPRFFPIIAEKIKGDFRFKRFLYTIGLLMNKLWTVHPGFDRWKTRELLS